jgi:predicted nucleic acid-binding protein
MKLYLDTSVPNAYLDDRTPERRAQTVASWPSLASQEVFVSDLVIAEIEATADENRRAQLLDLVRGFRLLRSKTDEVAALAQAYVSLAAVPAAALTDASTSRWPFSTAATRSFRGTCGIWFG